MVASQHVLMCTDISAKASSLQDRVLMPANTFYDILLYSSDDRHVTCL